MVFHNGGATTSTSHCHDGLSRQELAENSDNEGTESDQEGSEPERPMRAAPKAKARPLTLRPAIKQNNYSHLCLESASRARSACELKLRFVDSINVFPTSLAA